VLASPLFFRCGHRRSHTSFTLRGTAISRRVRPPPPDESKPVWGGGVLALELEADIKEPAFETSAVHTIVAAFVHVVKGTRLWADVSWVRVWDDAMRAGAYGVASAQSRTLSAVSLAQLRFAGLGYEAQRACPIFLHISHSSDLFHLANGMIIFPLSLLGRPCTQSGIGRCASRCCSRAPRYGESLPSAFHYSLGCGVFFIFLARCARPPLCARKFVCCTAAVLVAEVALSLHHEDATRLSMPGGGCACTHLCRSG
jgi:hypothetical protein